MNLLLTKASAVLSPYIVDTSEPVCVGKPVGVSEAVGVVSEAVRIA